MTLPPNSTTVWRPPIGRANATSSERWSSGWKSRVTRSMSCFGSTHIQVITIPKKKVCNFVGGEASPLLANIALHGLEEDLHRSLPHRQHGLDWRPTVIRYADDMVILHRDAETLQALRTRTETWLQRVGLQLKPSKTRIAHTLEPTHEQVGFDFLGFTVRQYRVSPHRSGKNGAGQRLGFKTLIR